MNPWLSLCRWSLGQPKCTQACDNLLDHIDELKDENLSLKRDLTTRNDQVVILTTRLHDLNLSLMALEKEVDILQDLLKVSEKQSSRIQNKKRDAYGTKKASIKQENCQKASS